MLYREERNHGLFCQGFSNVLQGEIHNILASVTYSLCKYISFLFAYYTADAFIQRGLLWKQNKQGI